MHKFLHTISLFLACTGLVLGGCGKSSETAQRQTEARSDSLKILTIGTADSGGTMYPVGKAISLVIGDADSSIKINISASTGSSGNVHSLQDGSIDLGLVSGDIAFSAVNGTGEFKDHEFKHLKVIAALYPSLSNWMARDDSGIFYVHDLKEIVSVSVPRIPPQSSRQRFPWALSESPTETPPSSTVVSDQALTRLKTGRLTRSMDLPGCRSPGLRSWQHGSMPSFKIHGLRAPLHHPLEPVLLYGSDPVWNL